MLHGSCRDCFEQNNILSASCLSVTKNGQTRNVSRANVSTRRLSSQVCLSKPWLQREYVFDGSSSLQASVSSRVPQRCLNRSPEHLTELHTELHAVCNIFSSALVACSARRVTSTTVHTFNDTGYNRTRRYKASCVG